MNITRKIVTMSLAVLMFVLQLTPAFAEKLSFGTATTECTDLANIVNGGTVARDDAGSWYCNNGIWYKPDEGDAEMRWETYATALMLHDGYLYYTDGEKNDSLYRRLLPEGEAEEVIPFSTECFQFMGDRLVFYCTRRLEHRGIFLAAADGSELLQISKANCTLLMTGEDKIYYVDKDDGHHLKRMDSDGNNVQTILTDYVYCTLLHDGKLYYSTTEYFGCADTDGRNSKRLYKIPAYRFTIWQDSFFLTAYSYKGTNEYPVGIFRLDSGMSQLVRICDEQAATLNIGGAKLYYKSFDNALTLTRIDLDGKNATYVAGGEALSVFDQIDQAKNESEDHSNTSEDD